MYFMNAYERFVELLGKKKSGNISLPEQRELMELTAQNPEFQKLSDTFESIYNTPVYQNKIAEKLWPSIEKKINTPEASEINNHKKGINRRLIISLSVAASLLVCFFSYKYYHQSAAFSRKENIVSTKKGSRSNLVLPDGTKVTLNADSKISYGENFEKNTREVSLSGEAYFDVKHDALHPFIIHTSDITIKVLGTAFNVRAYPNELNTETALIRGSLQVTLNEDVNQKIVLKPHQKILVRNEKAISKEKAVPYMVVTETQKAGGADSSVIETQWLNNKLAFNRESFENIVATLERWYGIKIEVYNKSVLSEKFSGVFENKPVEDVLKALQIVGKFDYERKNDIIIIK